MTLTLDSHTLLDFCTIGGIAESYVDDGVNHPVPIVTIDGVTLTQDVDYTVSYLVETSRGTVTVTGKGDYSGSKSKIYRLREPVLSDLHSLGWTPMANSSVPPASPSPNPTSPSPAR